MSTRTDLGCSPPARHALHGVSATAPKQAIDALTLLRGGFSPNFSPGDLVEFHQTRGLVLHRRNVLGRWLYAVECDSETTCYDVPEHAMRRFGHFWRARPSATRDQGRQEV
jgi:hypothetical protein